MASLRKEPNGSYRILIICPDGKRRSIRLDKGTTKGNAETVKAHIEHLAAALASNQPLDRVTAKWLGNTSDTLRKRLAKASLLQYEDRPRVTLGEFLDSYFDGREVKDSTETFYQHTRNRLEEFFKRSTPLEDIDAMQAREFRKWLATSNKRDKAKKAEGEKKAKPVPLAQNTIRRRIGLCRQVFAQAMQEGKIVRNPFVGMPTTVKANKDREYYIPLDVFDRIMESLKTEGQPPTAYQAHWRALLCLARLGAFRIPSEAQALKWEHIAWDAKRISVVLSSKTEHHENRAVRVVPLLPEIEAALSDLWQHAEEGAEHVFPSIDAESNLRTGLQRILAKAGIQQWPKLWQNLRSSGATDFARSLPAHVAASICGHTVEIAKEFYWQTTDEDLDQAMQVTATIRAQKCAQSAPNRAQNAAQQGGAKQGQNSPENSEFSSENSEKACVLQGALVGEEGLEPPTSTL